MFCNIKRQGLKTRTMSKLKITGKELRAIGFPKMFGKQK
jgi:hypothetical protein